MKVFYVGLGLTLFFAAVVPAAIYPELTSNGCSRGWCGNGNIISYLAVTAVLVSGAAIGERLLRWKKQKDAEKYAEDQRRYWEKHAVFQGTLYRLTNEGYETMPSNKPDFPPLEYSER